MVPLEAPVIVRIQSLNVILSEIFFVILKNNSMSVDDPIWDLT